MLEKIGGAVLALLLSLCCLNPLQAQMSGSADRRAVRGNIAYSWPSRLNKGYFPLWVELENLTASRQPVQLWVNSNFSQGKRAASKRLVLEPNESRRIELLVPTFSEHTSYGNWESYYVTLASSREKGTISGGFVELINDASLRTLLVLGERADEAQVLKWAQALKTENLRQWGSSTDVPNVAIGTAEMQFSMPSLAEAYSSLDLAVLDLSKQRPDAEALLVLLRWVRLGGRLLIVGAESRDDLRDLAGLSNWTEARFRIALPSNSVELPDAELYAAGLGLIALINGSEGFMKRDDHGELVQHLLFDRPGIAQYPQQVPRLLQLDRHYLELPGVGQLPYSLILLCLIGFAILIGPVNFIFLQRSGRPHLLLVTVPAIAFVASLALFLFGAFSQGFTAKGATQSLSLLDLRSDCVSSVQKLTAYHPLAPADGLRPGPGTAVFPAVAGELRRFSVEQDTGLLLSAGYLPVRTTLDQVTLSDRPAHLKLEFALGSEGIRMRNALPTRVQRLSLCAPDGSLYELASALEPGAEALLVPSAGTSEDGNSSSLLKQYLPPGFLPERPLLPSTFVAQVERSPFLDDCGVPIPTLVSEEHALIGILPERAEDW